MPELHLDFETYCELDIRKVGLGRYVAHPSFRVLLAAWAIDDGPVKQWVPVEGEPPPAELVDALADPEVLVWAHNAAFERHVVVRTPELPDVPIERWRDTMLLANTCALPADLARLTQVLGVSEDKAKLAGTLLINRFCRPTSRRKVVRGEGPGLFPDSELRGGWVNPDPERWEEFKEYNRRDVEAEREVHRLLSPYAPPDWVWEVWFQDQRINDRGVPVNLRFIRRAVELAQREKQRLLKRLAALTRVENPNSTAQLLPVFQSWGYPFDDLRKEHVMRGLAAAERRLEIGEDTANAERLVEALKLRLQAAASSTSKYEALARAAVAPEGASRGRVPHTLQFLGASRTGRWAGRIFQPQNLPRPHPACENRMEELARWVEFGSPKLLRWRMGVPVIEALRSAVRPAVQAPPGQRLVVCDWSAIENRLVGWICGDEAILQVFRDERDPYIDFARYLFGGTYEEIEHEVKVLKKKRKRTLAKPAVLGCLAAGTPVLTQRGWVPIENITRRDLVFNGKRFVSHGGLARQGYRRVVNVAGVWLTEDHEVYGEQGWCEAGSCYGRPWRPGRPLGVTRFCDTSEMFLPRARSMRSGAGHAVRSSRSAGAASRPPAIARHAGSAAGMSEAPYEGAPSTRRHMTGSRTGFTRPGPGAKTPETGRITGMAGEASSVCSRQRTSLSPMLFSASARQKMSKSIALTTTGITNRGTSVWCRARRTWRTKARHTRSSIKAGRGVRRSSIAGLPLGMPTLRRSPARPGKGRRRKKSLPNSDIAVARIVFDIVDVPETNAFVVLSAAGPMLVHNCGYRLGPGEVRVMNSGEEEATGLLGYARSMGVDMPPELAERAVKTFRETFSAVRDFWYEFEDQVKWAILNRSWTAGFKFRVDATSANFLKITLPSGRVLHYFAPAVVQKEVPWGGTRPTITYMGKHNNQWVRQGTHGGKLLENVTQAVAADLMMHGLVKAEEAGLNVVLHVHDEIVAVHPEDEAQEWFERLRELMSEPPSWAEDLPLAAAGGTYSVFQKD